MPRHAWLTSILLGLALAPADAQVSKLSKLPAESEVEDPRPFLQGLFGKSKPGDIDPKLLQELMSKLPKDQKHDPEQIKKMLNDNPQFRDPEFLKGLQKMLESSEFPKNLQGNLPKNSEPPKIDNGENLKGQLNEVIEKGKLEGMSKDVPPLNGGETPKPPEAPKFGDGEWGQWLEKNFSDSPAAQNAMKDLLSEMGKGNNGGLFDDVPELKNGGWNDISKWGGGNGDSAWDFKPPKMSGDGSASPKIGGSSFGGNSGGGGSSFNSGGSGANVDGLGAAATPLAVIAGIVGLIILVALLLRNWKRQQTLAGAARGTVRHSIDFEAIRTREELVRVFDAVSLDKIGDDARSWNHRVIAGELGSTTPSLTAPANELAGLYERARYAPNEETLSTTEFADARRDFKVIAGATA